MGAVLVITVLWARHEPAAPTGITLEPVRLLADGYDTATLTFHCARRPRIAIEPPYAATVESITDSTARIRASVLPAQIRVRVEFPNSPPATFRLATSLAAADSFQDGTPDFLRLDDTGPHGLSPLVHLPRRGAVLPGSRRPSRRNCRLRRPHPLRLPRDFPRARRGTGPSRGAAAVVPAVRIGGAVPVSLHAPRRRVVPRPRGTASAPPISSRRLRPIRRRPNPAALQYPFRHAAILRARSRRPALFPSGRDMPSTA